MEEQDANPGDNLFITGLSIRTTGVDLENIFGEYGKVSSWILYECAQQTSILN